MQHTIPVPTLVEKIGPRVNGMVGAIEACVHCGFCLPTCPTYQVLNEEMDSPRGRIILMKAVLEGDLEYQDVKPFIDQCLGCLACITACPSGVQYNELVSPFRALVNEETKSGFVENLQHKFIINTLPYPERFRTLIKTGRISKAIKPIVPNEYKDLLDLIPDSLTESDPIPEIVPVTGVPRGRVGLLLGCVNKVLGQRINWSTIRVLNRNGVEVIIPKDQVCCGALSLHVGEFEQAKNFARRNMQAFPDNLDAIISNAAGCGSAMKEYQMLFSGMEEEREAADFVRKVMDVSEYLCQIELEPFPEVSHSYRIAYQDACHLSHAQKVNQAPRDLISQIPNILLIEINEPEICCGSAGIYNIEHPAIAYQLGEKKINNIVTTNADIVVTGNIGCCVQIQTHFRDRAHNIPVYHTLELLDKAYAGNL